MKFPSRVRLPPGLTLLVLATMLHTSSWTTTAVGSLDLLPDYPSLPPVHDISLKYISLHCAPLVLSKHFTFRFCNLTVCLQIFRHGAWSMGQGIWGGCHCVWQLHAGFSRPHLHPHLRPCRRRGTAQLCQKKATQVQMWTLPANSVGAHPRSSPLRIIFNLI